MVAKGVIFDIEESQGDWFDFFESKFDFETEKIIYSDPKPNTGKVCIRSAQKVVTEQMSNRKKISEMVLNPKTRQMERIEYFQEKSFEEKQTETEDRIDYMITGLKDFFDIKGKPIECTRENKIKLSKVPMFDRFIAKCIELQANGVLEKMEKEEKTPANRRMARRVRPTMRGMS